nr:energy-coupling factor ABC transporter permease [uncultured Carboxylicivirga sp.]
MHMSDALVNPAVATTMYACSAGAATFAVKKLNRIQDNKLMANMGIMGAFIFAAQMINFSIPGTGSSGHIAGSVLLTAVLGPYAAFLTMIGVLLIQAFLFADGGILALGCNIWNMAFYGSAVAGVLFHQTFKKGEINRKRILLASVISSVIALQLGAFSVTIQTLASNITDLPFHVFVSLMQPIHLAIGLIEGLITAAILYFVYQARPEFLWFVNKRNARTQVQRNNRVWFAFVIGFIVLGGIISHFASSDPDGLEWSIARINPEFGEDVGVGIKALADHIQQFTAILPDYNLASGETITGTSLSGILGGCIVLILFTLVGFLTKKIISRSN